MAFWIRDTALRLRQQGIELHKKTLDTFTRTVYTPNNTGRQEYTQKLPNNETEDLRWLL
jgi:uncharacterized protein YjbK